MIPFVDLKAQYASVKDEVNAAIQGVLDSCQFTLGSEVAAFEREFAAYCHSEHGIGVNTGTSALHLALLAGVRDAQAYNPLLLRRSVEYFAEINRGQTDDHWLWLSDFQSPHVDRLAVRRVLAAGGEWRVTERLLASELKVAPHATQVVDVSRQRARAGRVRIVSYSPRISRGACGLGSKVSM